MEADVGGWWMNCYCNSEGDVNSYSRMLLIKLCDCMVQAVEEGLVAGVNGGV